MIDSISISNFKAITTELKLENLASVNYLVGKNGSGKSSVLEAIEFFNSKNFDLGFSNFTKKINSRNFYSGFSTIIKQKINDLNIKITDDEKFKSLWILGEEKKENIISFIRQFVTEKIIFYTNNLQIQFYLNESNRKGLRIKNTETTWASNFFRDVWRRGIKPIIEIEEKILINEFCNRFPELSNEVILSDLKNVWNIFVISEFRNYIEDITDESKLTKTNFLYNAVISQEINISNFFDLQFKEDVLDNKNREELLGLLVKIGGFKHIGQKIIYADRNVLVFDDKENTSILIETLSSGQKIIIKFFYLTKKNNTNTILIDEPETSLHPEVQKMLPKLFASFPSVQFFVATHSPFIISAAAGLENQKVYLLENGQTVGIDDSDNGQNGYEDGKCLQVVNTMLGVEKTDYGMPENYILVEESSKKDFLNGLFSRKEFAKNIGVIATAFGNDAELPNEEEKIRNLITNNSLVMGNVFFTDKYIVFTDFVPTYYDQENEKWIKNSKSNNGNNPSNKAMNIKINLKERFVAISEELENLYPKHLLKRDEKLDCSDWTSGTFAKYLKSKNISNTGKLKCELAKHVGKNITLPELQTHFKELYDLLYGAK